MYRQCVYIIVLAISASAAAQPYPAYNRMTGWAGYPADALGDSDVLQQTQDDDSATWRRFQIRDSGSGPPAGADCAVATDFGYMYLDYGSVPRRFYRCAETGLGEGWDYVELTD